eukprot:8401186-Pyramimonas_sp.AAC.1
MTTTTTTACASTAQSGTHTTIGSRSRNMSQRLLGLVPEYVTGTAGGAWHERSSETNGHHTKAGMHALAYRGSLRVCKHKEASLSSDLRVTFHFTANMSLGSRDRLHSPPGGALPLAPAATPNPGAKGASGQRVANATCNQQDQRWR